jgi:hypothetical protein
MEYDTYEYSDVPSHTTYTRRFGSWREALEAAGIPLDPTNTGYDRETLLKHLRDLAERLGRTPSISDVDAADGPCSTTYANWFGSWSAALVEAGFELKPPHRRYGREELLDILRALAEELGHAPTMVELWQRDDLPRPSTYKVRFGRWNAALREAGLTPRHPKPHVEDADVGPATDNGASAHRQAKSEVDADDVENDQVREAEDTNHVIRQSQALTRAIEAVETIEPTGLIERVISWLLLQAYRRRLRAILARARR